MTFIPSFSITLGTTSSEEDFEKSNVTDFCAHIVIGNNSIRHNTTNFLVIVIKFYNFVNQVCSRLCLYLIKKKIGTVDYSLSIMFNFCRSKDKQKITKSHKLKEISTKYF